MSEFNEHLLTPKQVARAMGVSESSLKRWCDRGLIRNVRTAGGHRRLPVSGVLEYLRSSQQTLLHPEVLGLPATSGQTERTVERGRELLTEALLEGDEERCRHIVLDLFLAGQSVSTLCDHLFAESFVEIGERWACGEADVYQERRACEICVRILLEIRQALPPVAADASAIGGTLSGDHYMLPTTMAEVVLRDNGWDARSLGTGLPVESAVSAVRRLRPRLFWVSVSHIEETARFLHDLPALSEATSETGTALVVGGRALTEDIRQQLDFSAHGDTMQHLESFARTLRQAHMDDGSAPSLQPSEN